MMGKNTKRDSLMDRHEEAAQKAAKGEITSDYLRLQSYAPSYQGKRDTYENTLKALQEADTDLMREEKKAARAKGMKSGSDRLDYEFLKHLERTYPSDIGVNNLLSKPSFKKGGKVKSAAARADGCAKRGKTRGRMV